MRFEEIVNCKGSLIGTHSSITLHSNTEKRLEFEELFENGLNTIWLLMPNGLF